jgi:hypothetical protein
MSFFPYYIGYDRSCTRLWAGFVRRPTYDMLRVGNGIRRYTQTAMND